MKYNFIEVCSGAGGMSHGFIEAGLVPIFLNDIDYDSCKTLCSNHPNALIYHGDFLDIDYSEYKGKIDLMCGGVPCQSFSQAGQRKGLDDPRGSLLIQFLNLVHEIKPKIFLLENVKGLLTHESGQTFKYILNYLKEKNIYEIHHQLINAYDYQVPQKRERIILIGTLKSIPIIYKFPEKKADKLTLKDALRDVPVSPGSQYSEKKKNLFKYIPPGGSWINLPIDLQKEYLGKSYNSGGGKRGILYRLSWDRPSLTILCSPSQKQTERCHPDEDRPLTIRESARIQTFPDDYKFIGSISSQYKQIGNAVPPRMAYHLALSIINFLEQC